MRVYTQNSISRMFLFFVVILMTFSSTIYADKVPLKAREAAEKGLPSFLKAIPIEELGHFNFSYQDDLYQSVLGKPFMIYTITPEQILNYRTEMPVGKIISPTQVWYFPVIMGGEFRTLLTVDFMGVEWKAVAIGASGIAKQWASIMNIWPSSKGYEHTFIRVFQATADFVLLTTPEETKMVPFDSALISLGLTKKEAYNPSEIILKLQRPVRINMESSESFNKE